MAQKTPAFQELSSTQVAGLQVDRYLVVWPVASLEQHGPHLPLGTDALVLQAVVDGVREQLGESFPALFLPLQALGKSPEHLAFVGTVSLQMATMVQICEDIVSSLAAHGFKRFVFLNGHGGNTALLQSFGFDLRHKYQVKIYNIDLWGSSFFDEITAKIFPNLVGNEVHAGSIEASMMMYLYPELVGELPHTSAPTDFGKPVHFSWSSQDFGADGVIGDPTQATIEKGKIIVRHAIEKTTKLIREISSMAG